MINPKAGEIWTRIEGDDPAPVVVTHFDPQADIVIFALISAQNERSFMAWKLFCDEYQFCEDAEEEEPCVTLTGAREMTQRCELSAHLLATQAETMGAKAKVWRTIAESMEFLEDNKEN